MPRILARKAAGRTGELFIYDDIGESFFAEGLTAKSVLAELEKVRGVDVLNVRINSQGGEVFDGTAIYNAIRRFGARVEVDIDGAALSIASVIAMAGDEIRIAGNGMMMIHNPKTGSYGDAAQMRSLADRLDKARDNLAETYATRRGLNVEDVISMMQAETWMKPSEAVALGFADRVTAELDVVVNADSTRFMNCPDWANSRSRMPGSRSIYHVKTLGF